MKRVSSYCLFSTLLLILSYSPVSAGIRPSFVLETCAWNATDILVATEGKKIDGVFRVLETWKGDLNAGDTIKIPELALFLSESSRNVSDSWYQREKSSPTTVTGERMVLFLKRAHPLVPDSSNDAQLLSPTIKWLSTSPYDGMDVSVVSIEQGQTFGFVQVINPGASLLIRLGLSEDEMKHRVQEIEAVHISLLQASAIDDLSRRAEALGPFTHHGLYQVQDTAFEELKKVGPAALPVLRTLLANDSLIEIHRSLVEVLAAAGKNEACPDLVGLLKKDLEFWKVTGPVLKSGWWNAEGFDSLEEVEPLRDRYSRDHQALMALTKRPYRESETVVREFRDFWRSLPHLADEIGDACDAALAESERLKASRNAIRFEGLQTFDESELLKAVRETGVGGTDGTSPFSADVVDKAKIVIQNSLASQGRTRATVVAEIDEGSRALTFVIDEGPRVGIAEIRFEGNKAFSSQLLGSEIKRCLAEYDDDAYNSGLFGNCLHKLHNFVRSKGYLQAKFDEPEKQETDDGLVMTIRADEGPRYRLGKLTIGGSSFRSSEQVRATIGLQTGDIANGEKIAEALFEDLKQQYGSNGYIQYTAEITPTFRKTPGNAEEGVVDFEVMINEGKQFKLRSIKLLGSDLPQKQLRDLLSIRDGEVFNQQLYDAWVEKLNESELLDSIDWASDADFKTDKEHGLIDIVIKLKRNRFEGDSEDGPPNGATFSFPVL